MPLPTGPARVRAPAPADVHAVDEGRDRRRTTRTSPSKRMFDIVGEEHGAALQEASISLYAKARDHAATRGHHHRGHEVRVRPRRTDEVTLVDEVLTPDSSRFWPADAYEAGHGQPSFDKQYVRDWLESSGWDKTPPPPALPADVIAKTSEKYIQAYELITRPTPSNPSGDDGHVATQPVQRPVQGGAEGQDTQERRRRPSRSGRSATSTPRSDAKKSATKKRGSKGRGPARQAGRRRSSRRPR